ncbi:MAG: PmoA family protein [Vicinamibacterales bacterium]
MRRLLATCLVSPFLIALAMHAQAPPRIQVVPDDVAPRVDISIDGKPFTSYLYAREMKKPTLFPLRTAHGNVVTRGYPLEPRPFERADHPHHIGLWFNYGDVNGLDFWNNSSAIGHHRAPRMGTVIHKRVIEATSGKDKGELNVEMDWVDSKGTALLKEVTRFVFRGDAESRTIDRITRLSALKEPVVLGDNKEGLLGMRVARELEQPSKGPEALLDASGKPTKQKVVHNDGVTGHYTGSDGKTGDAVWGTRGPWAMLAGTVDSEQVALAILDHPSNPGFPTYWHARGYGLFAANNLGRKVFDPTQEEAKRTIKPGESITFRHRVLILSGAAGADRMAAEQRTFAEQK